MKYHQENIIATKTEGILGISIYIYTVWKKNIYDPEDTLTSSSKTTVWKYSSLIELLSHYV